MQRKICLKTWSGPYDLQKLRWEILSQKFAKSLGKGRHSRTSADFLSFLSPSPCQRPPAPAPLLVLHMFSFRPHGAQFNAIKIGHKGHIARPWDNLDTGKLKQNHPEGKNNNLVTWVVTDLLLQLFHLCWPVAIATKGSSCMLLLVGPIRLPKNRSWLWLKLLQPPQQELFQT